MFRGLERMPLLMMGSVDVPGEIQRFRQDRDQPHRQGAPSVSWKGVPLPVGRWPDSTDLCPLGSRVHGLAAFREAIFRGEEQ